ncbi:MAG: 2-succinyl-6-hydroxy-2,4-cyclohexadiene-1-carboxylate synthase [Rhodocyclaceae bacterium]|jgi:2-succinyl-6-hydroxy-2,4-cyclohexadiene-1-carboxylate synthase|nr:2-succinyl-6-hydroxy-2,4-cyclohexadiene-1-carboxylate synthase [Rhodocyclaceae bacterium]
MPSSDKSLAVRIGGKAGVDKPWLVWLHGLFGSGDDWREVLPAFTDFPCLTVDLPGHGDSQAIDAGSLADVDGLFAATLARHGIRRYWLIGYSLGGRIAGHFATRGDTPPGLCGLIVEAAHPGLPPDERPAREEHDRAWAGRLRCEPLAQVLDDWYRQPPFADLDAAQRVAMAARRASNDPVRVAMLLEACTLARQPDMAAGLAALTLPFAFLCGERDAKFQALARRCGFPLHSIADAGHNAHAAQPAAFAATILDVLHRRN